MPTYHYICKSCKHEFEELQTNSEGPLVICPSCKKHSLARMIGGGGGLVFKGSGFYITDYKSKSSSSHNQEEKTETKPKSKSDTKSESKPETKAETKAHDSSKQSGDASKKD